VRSFERFVRIRPKGQVTVPTKQLALLDLRAGDQLLSRVEGDRIVLSPVEVTKRRPRFETTVAPKPSRAQLAERRRLLARTRPLTAQEFEGLEVAVLQGPSLTDEELEAAVGEGRE
jgi:bifunctional DNA-binding transcriptional regulator/antitoxin component of YhaV-PrlF toxin-antitoxin module